MAARSAWDWLAGRPEGVRRTLWATVSGRFDPHAVLARGRKEATAVVDPQGWRDVLSAADLPRDRPVEVFVGSVPIALVRHGTGVVALDGTCPHAGGPLGEGDVDGDRLVCPLHGWAFDLRTGACDTEPGVVVRTWPARIRDGRVEIGADRP